MAGGNVKLSNLDIYRSFKTPDEDAIVHKRVNEFNRKITYIEQGGTYLGPLSALKRTDSEKAANNEARTQLLEALGRTFDLESTTRHGEAVFTKEFMSKLEKLLGRAFKRSDFGIDKDGRVASGRPLTQRRIKAIVAKAEKLITEKRDKNPTIRTITDEQLKSYRAMSDDYQRSIALPPMTLSCINIMFDKLLPTDEPPYLKAEGNKIKCYKHGSWDTLSLDALKSEIAHSLEVPPPEFPPVTNPNKLTDEECRMLVDFSYAIIKDYMAAVLDKLDAAAKARTETDFCNQLRALGKTEGMTLNKWINYVKNYDVAPPPDPVEAPSTYSDRDDDNY